METRTIKITFNKAKEWYNSDNPSLKEIALQAFSKKELEQIDLKEVINLILNYAADLTDTQRIQLKSLKNREDITKVSAPKLLRILACYFNGRFWKKKEGEEGYFFYKSGFANIYSPNVLDKYWRISSHISVCYPTLVYFKREGDCKEAYNIMKSLGKLDALYTDF